MVTSAALCGKLRVLEDLIADLWIKCCTHVGYQATKELLVAVYYSVYELLTHVNKTQHMSERQGRWAEIVTAPKAEISLAHRYNTRGMYTQITGM